MKRRYRGFSLVEVSVILLGLGVLLLGASAFWQNTARMNVAALQQGSQRVVKDSMVGFLYANHRLPCPAADSSGTESCLNNKGEPRKVGYVPWRTLGLPRPDIGNYRYGVYREASATAELDRDLATIRDRMKPLRVQTPQPRPSNADAPNGNAPPNPVASAALLGATQSGSLSSPLNASCNAGNLPPCPVGGVGSVNQVDVCLALNTASELTVAAADQVALKVGTERKAMAFVVVAPDLLDADGNGSLFTGDNAKVSDANPTFVVSGSASSPVRDASVLAVSPLELFAELSCATGMASGVHTHFNAATGAFVLERALYDYRDQLYVKVKLAEADVAAAIAGNASAVAAGVDAAQAVASATADSFASVGARSFQIGLAAVGVGLAVAGATASVLATVETATALSDAKTVHSDFAERTTSATDLSISINRNALLADAIGF